MTQADTEFTIIEQLLEAIFLDQEDLDQLKHEIKEVSKGTLDPLQLKKTIWSSRIRFKQEMINDFLPYYKELMKKSSPAQSHCSELYAKIKEREDLLETIAIKLNTLYHKVKEKNESGYTNDLQELSQISKSSSSIKKVN